MASKYERDAAAASGILKKQELTAIDRAILIGIYNPAYHGTGKIEGITSFDGCALSCEFCQKMRKAAEKDHTIICGDCYAAALAEFRTNMAKRHELNQEILSSVLFEESELAAIYIGSRFARFNSDGDCRNTTMARNYIRIAKSHPQNKFALWFKNLSAVKAAVELEGKPENLIIIFSSCRLNHCGKAIRERYNWIDYTFTVYVDHESTDAAIAAGAAECNGRKCRDCGYKCYAGTHPAGSDIAEYLRGISKEKRAALVKACASSK